MNKPTIMGVALCHKKVVHPCVNVKLVQCLERRSKCAAQKHLQCMFMPGGDKDL